MKRVLAALVLLLLLTTSVFAADSSGNTSIPSVSSSPTTNANNNDTTGALTQAQNFADTLAPPETDYSVAYLGQIFGTVGNVLQSTSGQILGKMFDIFNKGVLVVAALWLCMTTVQVSFRAAQDGSFMGQNRNVMFTMLRVALGFALIIPSSTTGYSLLQDVFMKIVVQGVGLADQIWDAALNYLEYGGSLYIPPATLSNSTDIVNSFLMHQSQPSGSTSSETPFVAQIFQNEVCMLASSNWEKKQNEQTTGGTTGGTAITNSGSYINYAPVYDKKNGTIYFPGLGNSSNGSASDYSVTYTGSTYKTNATCGFALDYYSSQQSTKTPATNTTPTATQNAEANYSYSAMKQVVSSLMPAAQAYVTAHSSNPKYTTSESNSLLSSNGKIAFSAILAYINLITPYQKLLNEANTASSTPGVQNKSAAFIQNAEAQGWIMAGSLYWQVEQANAKSSSLSVTSLVPQVGGPSVTGHADILADALTAGSGVYPITTTCSGTSSSNATYPIPGIEDTGGCVGSLWQQYVGAQQNITNVTSTTGGSGSANSDIGRIASSAVVNVVGGITGLTSNKYNPISILMREGKRLLEDVVGIWIGAITVSATIALGAAICSSVSPGFLLAETVITWFKSILMLLCAMLLIPGVILAYYVPLYPFIVFTFAAVGWFLMVIEGMVAAPLVCVGVTHPEGHDFLGKSEQALMLFLSIFLRPALMIIGLVAAMVTSFVAFKLLNTGFMQVFNSLVNTSHNAYSSNNDLLSLISICAVLVIFGILTMELIEQCFKFTYTLPNYIMKWIGAPGWGEEHGQAAARVSGAVSQVGVAGKEVAGGFGGAADAGTKGLKDYKKAKEAKKAEDEGNVDV